MKVINELQNVALHGTRNGHIVDQTEMNHVFTETNTTGMRADRDTESGECVSERRRGA